VPYFLGKYDPDVLRFYLTATAPETRDTEFSWEDFVERNNNELVATWGNLCQRPKRALGFMLSFAYNRNDGVVPVPGELDDEDRVLSETGGPAAIVNAALRRHPEYAHGHADGMKIEEKPKVGSRREVTDWLREVGRQFSFDKNRRPSGTIHGSRRWRGFEWSPPRHARGEPTNGRSLLAPCHASLP
jgi:hypothetical protein